jgi:hypothetical protein
MCRSRSALAVIACVDTSATIFMIPCSVVRVGVYVQDLQVHSTTQHSHSEGSVPEGNCWWRLWMNGVF